jgi:hypothetical protein
MHNFRAAEREIGSIQRSSDRVVQAVKTREVEVKDLYGDSIPRRAKSKFAIGMAVRTTPKRKRAGGRWYNNFDRAEQFYLQEIERPKMLVQSRFMAAHMDAVFWSHLEENSEICDSIEWNHYDTYGYFRNRSERFDVVQSTSAKKRFRRLQRKLLRKVGKDLSSSTTGRLQFPETVSDVLSGN